ncbi:MAG: NAD-glutamate dehydrogenase, partial [Burkholderiales bacterium]
MNRDPRARTSSAVEHVIELVRARAPAEHRDQLEEFVHQFYRQVDAADLADRAPQDLYGAALSLWHFARRRTGDAVRVRVYNPREEEHGWQSPHTVIELVQRDMPFLVDSVRMELKSQGFSLLLIIHPVIRLRRTADGELLELSGRDASAADMHAESMMHIEIGRETDPQAIARLEQAVLRVLGEVHCAVDDWQAMLQRMREEIESIGRDPPPLPEAEITEGVAFLQWLTANNFIFLGSRDYELEQRDGEDVLNIVPGSGLGLLRIQPGEATSATFASLPAAIRERARKKELLIVTKSNTRATVHRPGYMDYIGVKRLDAGGRVIGERRFLGLYTSVAYNRSATEIPLLSRKVKAVMERSGVIPGSHLFKALVTILEQYPRDELFQIDEDDLLRIATGILHLQDRQRTRLFVRRDPFGRFFSFMVYVPRDNYSSEVRRRMQDVLMQAAGGISTEFSVSLTESVLARVLILVHTGPGAQQEFDERELEAELVRVTRRWQDDLADALTERLGEERGSDLYRTYGEAFPAGYREDTLPRAAVHDIEIIDRLGAKAGIGMSLYQPLEAREGELRFRLYRRGAPVPLSQSLPLLERMGVRVIDEVPYHVEPEGGESVWIRDMGLQTDGRGEVRIDTVREPFHDAFRHVWLGESESDDFNCLVLSAGLQWREIAVLRAYAKYARQAGFPFSEAYMQAALGAHPKIAAELVALFRARFDPDLDAELQARGARHVPAIEAALEQVASLDEDRILRRFLALIQATTRCNFFQTGTDGAPKPYLALKFDPSLVPGLPAPRPMFEIYVYSPRVEGVHLRGGRTARGGIRWSDRMEDFRTEVLGLMKAQMVKNAVIVPVGAKGGFVVKNPPQGADRETLMREVVHCYTTFLRGLLDLTGNRVGGAVSPPPRMVRHDQDDTYLVVAADKGTATFSDTANQIAL